MTSFVPVLLSGGSGTRLWPLSREAYPKQFLPLLGELSLLQRTWLRLDGLPCAAPLIVANEEHRFMVAEQMQRIGATPAAIILEPVGRNTAPAIAVAALQAMSQGDDPVLLVLPSDHVINDEAGFRAAVLAALPAAESGALVTFGIVPSAPETGYGYIKARPGDGVRTVECFVEKPDQATADAYVASGDSGTVRVHALSDGHVRRRTRVPVGSYNVQRTGGRVLTPSLGTGALTVLDLRGAVVARAHIASAAHDACIV